MRFKLLKSVLSAAFCALPFNSYSQTTPSDVTSYKGRIDALRSDSLSAAALRADGRYLFLSKTGASFLALDLQDMGLEGSSISADGSIVDLFMPSSTEIIATHQKGVQYFDVSKPFSISKFDAKYTRPTETPTRTVSDSCWLGQRKTALLEESTGSEHIVRFVEGSNLVAAVTWASIFPSATTALSPMAIWCTADSVLLLAMEGSWGTKDSFRLARISASNQSISTASFTLTDRFIDDAVLSPRLDQLLVLANRQLPQDNREDARVVAISTSSLETTAVKAAGSGARALAAFKLGDQFRLGVFVDTFYPEVTASESTRFPMTALPLTNSSSFEGRWGEGSSAVGSRKPSLWLSSGVDHYKYGLSESAGVSLLGSGPNVTLTTRPEESQITASSPLTLSFSADRRIQYQLRLKQDYAEDGSSAGLSREYGTLVSSGVIDENQSSGELTFSISDLNLSLERSMSLSLIAWDPALSQGSEPQTRIGIPFVYDEPPSEVRNLVVKSGDQSVHLYFDPPVGGDISQYYVDYSFEATDLDSFDPDASRSFESGISGYTLTSPKIVSASNQKTHIVLSPIENYRELYFKIYAADKAGQLTESPQLKSAQGYDTLSVAQALGGTRSCSLGVSTQRAGSLQLWAVSVFLILLGFVRFSGKKNWVQHF
jgi:hypothetical protein